MCFWSDPQKTLAQRLHYITKINLSAVSETPETRRRTAVIHRSVHELVLGMVIPQNQVWAVIPENGQTTESFNGRQSSNLSRTEKYEWIY